MFKKILVAIILAICALALWLSGNVYPAEAAGPGEINNIVITPYAVDPYGGSFTTCNWQLYDSTADCVRFYRNGTFDYGTWTGGFNGNIRNGMDYRPDTNRTALCVLPYDYAPWRQWYNGNCVLMDWNTRSFLIGNQY